MIKLNVNDILYLLTEIELKLQSKMSIKLQQLLSDFHVPFETSGTEISRGWIGLQCPFCGDDKTHLGYHEGKDLLTCWRCGPKRMFPTLKAILGIPGDQLAKILKKYGSITQYDRGGTPRTMAKQLVLPPEFGQLNRKHRQYLEGRGFDPDDIVSRWGILGTGSDSKNGYSNRIIIPIYQGGKLVSFHSRDITGEARIAKKACKVEDEVVHFKDTLYGYDRVKSNTVIVSEGPFDVWRWGYGAVCTWGIKFSEKQVDLLTTFKNIFIVFDSNDEKTGKEERQAAEQAEKLADRLAIFQNVWIIDDLGSDPADMKQRKADAIRRRINKITEGVTDND